MSAEMLKLKAKKQHWHSAHIVLGYRRQDCLSCCKTRSVIVLYSMIIRSHLFINNFLILKEPKRWN